MKLLEDRILKDGRVIGNNILKVDSFINHQMDIALFNEIGKEFKRLFSDVRVDKILTIEASGIGIACITAQYFNVPVVFSKKILSNNIGTDYYKADVISFTKNTLYKIFVSKDYLKTGENILIIDDFLANGQAALGLINLINQANANVIGAGFVIEKSFQGGREKLLQSGIKVESLAIIKSMNDNKVIFE